MLMYTLLRWSFLTLSKVTQLSTNHRSIHTSPGVTTHSTPHIVYTYLHSALICTGTSHQLQLTGCARSYMQQENTQNATNETVIQLGSCGFTHYLHNLHQHHESGCSHGTGLVCWDILATDLNWMYTEHHPGKLVHCQHQSVHCCMPCHLYTYRYSTKFNVNKFTLTLY